MLASRAKAQVFAGGGMGRTPMIGKVLKEFLPQADLLPYLEAVVSVYNILGRRDNKYKARIKILVKALGAEEFARLVEEEWLHLKDKSTTLIESEIERMKSFFTEPSYVALDDEPESFVEQKNQHKGFANWVLRIRPGIKACAKFSAPVSCCRVDSLGLYLE